MKKPISAGDMCEVINGSAGKSSPNIGLIVVVRQRIFECPTLGVIWRCEAAYAERLVLGPKCTCPAGMADFAQDWLRRIDDEPKAANTTKKKELSI